MTNSQRLATVRRCLLRWLAQQNAISNDGDAPSLEESFLIRDGFYCGRQFNLGEFRAVWFMEEDELKIHGSSGEVACVLSGEEIKDIETSEETIDAQAPIQSGEPSQGDVISMPQLSAEESRDDEDLRRAA